MVEILKYVTDEMSRKLNETESENKHWVLFSEEKPSVLPWRGPEKFPASRWLFHVVRLKINYFWCGVVYE